HRGIPARGPGPRPRAPPPRLRGAGCAGVGSRVPCRSHPCSRAGAEGDRHGPPPSPRHPHQRGGKDPGGLPAGCHRLHPDVQVPEGGVGDAVRLGGKHSSPHRVGGHVLHRLPPGCPPGTPRRRARPRGHRSHLAARLGPQGWCCAGHLLPRQSQRRLASPSAKDPHRLGRLSLCPLPETMTPMNTDLALASTLGVALTSCAAEDTRSDTTEPTPTTAAEATTLPPETTPSTTSTTTTSSTTTTTSATTTTASTPTTT